MNVTLIGFWLAWIVLGGLFVGLVYAGVRRRLDGRTVGIGLGGLMVICLVMAITMPQPDPLFPELIDTDPLRDGIDDGLNWVVRNWGGFFEAIAYPFMRVLLTIEWLLLQIPWFVIFAVFGALAYVATRRTNLTLVVVGGLLFIGIMDLWEDAVSTMALMIAATLTAIVLGLPVGIAMARSAWLRRALTPVLDLMQTMPSFVYLIPTVMIFGPGQVPALIATIVYASPPLVRLTDLGIRQVDPDVLEATQAFGADQRQKLFGVQIPLALPTILAGINQTTMMALAMVVIASMIGAGGLGYQVLQGIGRLEVSRGLFAGLGIVVLAIVFDRITQSFGKQLQERIGLAEER